MLPRLSSPRHVQRRCLCVEDERAKLEAEIQRLEVRLENQELSAADVQHMAKEKAMLKDSIARVATQRETAQEGLWEVEMAVTKEMDTVRAVACTWR